MSLNEHKDFFFSLNNIYRARVELSIRDVIGFCTPKNKDSGPKMVIK